MPSVSKLTTWFTDERRQALHAAIGSLGALLVAGGLVTDAQSTALLGLAGSVLIVVQGVLSLTLLRPSEFGTWFDTVGRGIIYGLATAAGAVGIAFGLWADDDVTRWLGLIALALTVLSSFVAVVNVQTVDEGATLPSAQVLSTRAEYRDALEQKD